MNVTELIQRVRDIIGEHQTQEQEWEDIELLRELNAANDTMFRKAQEADEGWGVDVVTLDAFNPVVTSVNDAIIRVELTTHEIGKVISMEEHQAGFTGFPGMPITASDPKQGLHEFLPSSVRGLYEFRSWWPGPNDRVMFFAEIQGTPFVAAQVLVWAIRKHPRLVRFKTSVYADTSTLTVAGGSAELGRVMEIPSYYKHALIECTDTTPAGDPKGQRMMVESFTKTTYPNYLMKTSTAHGLSSGESTWEVHPWWPEEHHECIAAIAASTALLKASDFEGKVEVDKHAGKCEFEFVNLIEQRQFQTPRMVVYEDWG